MKKMLIFLALMSTSAAWAEYDQRLSIVCGDEVYSARQIEIHGNQIYLMERKNEYPYKPYVVSKIQADNCSIEAGASLEPGQH